MDCRSIHPIVVALKSLNAQLYERWLFVIVISVNFVDANAETIEQLGFDKNPFYAVGEDVTSHGGLMYYNFNSVGNNTSANPSSPSGIGGVPVRMQSEK